MKLPRWFTIPLLAFLITRLFIFGVGLVADTMLTTEPGHWIADPDSPFLSMWTKWDSQYYVDIATNGYWFRPEQQSNVAFFPVYPLLMRLVGSLVQGNVILAGFIISNLAFFIALIFLYKLTALELDDGSAGRTVFTWLFSRHPSFSSVYTESTFLMFSVAA
ncbi:MAG: mannosyltransferase family protein, partial [Chloroflexota bacterium]